MEFRKRIPVMTELLHLKMNRKEKKKLRLFAALYFAENAINLVSAVTGVWIGSAVAFLIVVFGFIWFVFSSTATDPRNGESFRRKAIAEFLRINRGNSSAVIEAFLETLDREIEAARSETIFSAAIQIVVGTAVSLVSILVALKMNRSSFVIVISFLFLAVCFALTALILNRVLKKDRVHGLLTLRELLTEQRLIACGSVSENVLQRDLPFGRKDGEFQYKAASETDLERLWNREIASSEKQAETRLFKRRFIKENRKGWVKTFVVIRGEDRIGQGTLIFSPKSKQVKEIPGICAEGKTANVAALRIEKEFEGQGHVSALVKLMEHYALLLGIETLTIGVEAGAKRTKAIYDHWGFCRKIGETGGEDRIEYFEKSIGAVDS